MEAALDGGAPEPVVITPLWRRLLIGRNPKRTLLRACLTALTLIVVFQLVLIPVRVTGISMQPSYPDGRICLVNRLAYCWHRPQRGDVVLVRTTDMTVVYLKRVVAVPGETLAISGGVVLINGQPLEEPYVRERARWSLPPSQVRAEEYFVIGDNRGMPQQAHYFGASKAERIVGKVLW